MPVSTRVAVATLAVLALGAGVARGETRVTYKSAKAGTSYYLMGVQLAEAMKAGTKGQVIITVEESQGSVQNVKEAAARSGNYVFTTPPGLVASALAGKKPFEPKDAKLDRIRALFPIPSLTMHYVVREDAGVKSFADLAGKAMVIGKGSFGAREAVANFKAFGIDGKVKVIDIELSGAGAAVKNKQVDGFVTASSWPAPNVVEVAAGTKVRVLSMSDDQVAQTKRTKIVIPKGTYPGIDADIVTTSLPVVAYTLADMDDATAYQLTKTFWEGRAAMAKANPWWAGVTTDMLAAMSGKLHPGALRYYTEAKVAVPDKLR
ncbi:MAG: TAXI family TRAP transporter solute-binding subunit [Hyphomicrobiaceae bacterium]